MMLLKALLARKGEALEPNSFEQSEQDEEVKERDRLELLHWFVPLLHHCQHGIERHCG